MKRRDKTRFELYYTLCNNIPKEPLSKYEIESLEKVESINEEFLHQILGLIKEHNKKTSSSEKDTIPYKGKQTPRGLEFKIKNLPVELCRIIIKFLKYSDLL